VDVESVVGGEQRSRPQRSPGPAVSSRPRNPWLRTAAWLFVAIVAAEVLMSLARVYGWWGFNASQALGGITVVIAGWIPTWFQVQLILTGAGLLLMLTGFVRAFFGPLPRVGPEPPLSVSGKLGFFLQVTALLALVIAVPLTLGVSALGSFASYRILPEEDGNACRIVERDFGRYGSSRGILPSGAFVVDWTPSASIPVDASATGPRCA
jgi:hypothetical protein